MHSDNDFASVAYLRIKDAALEEKTAPVSTTVRVPPLLTEANEEVENSILSWGYRGDSESRLFIHTTPVCDDAPSIKRIGRWIAIGNVEGNKRTDHLHQLSLEVEVRACFSAFRGKSFFYSVISSAKLITHHNLDILARQSLVLSNIAHINVYISSIQDFARINAVYSTMFGTSPPTRACVAVDLPEHVRVRMDCLAYAESNSHDRQALHVQSLSYWAPANIGPYSQAVVVSPYHPRLPPEAR